MSQVFTGGIHGQVKRVVRNRTEQKAMCTWVMKWKAGNESIGLKVFNYLFSLSFLCPHQLTTRRAKGRNVLTVAGVSGTESFSHCANKPKVSQSPKPDQCVPAIPALVAERHWEKNQITVQQPPPALLALASSRSYLLCQGSSSGPRVHFICSTLPCRGSQLTANAVHSAHFIPCWKEARPEVERGKHSTVPGNSTQLLKTSREKAVYKCGGFSHRQDVINGAGIWPGHWG